MYKQSIFAWDSDFKMFILQREDFTHETVEISSFYCLPVETNWYYHILGHFVGSMHVVLIK